MKYKKDSLGDRMKGYENETRYYLTGKNPIIIRLDGKAFHTFTKGFRKPFDNILEMTMRKTMLYLCENIQGVSFAYTQSDEISLLLTNINMTPEYQHWFNGNIQKMASVSASMVTMAFNHYFWDEVWENINPNDIDETPYWNSKPFDRNDDEYGNPKYAMFDSRVFSLPHHEVVNYFIWRQQDAIRNSKQALGQAHFSQNQLHGKNCDQICEMLKTEKEIDWYSLPVYQQRGTCAEKHRYEHWFFAENEPDTGAHVYYRTVWEPDLNIPIFTENRGYVAQHAGPTPEEQDLWEAFWRDL